MVKERQSNIELLRIVAMLMVLIVHANYWRIGVPTHAEAIASPLPTFVRILIQHLASPCVDVFIIISGYFSIRPKLKSVANLWFLLAFWGGVSVMIDGGTFWECVAKIVQPFLGWFIPAYLGLYLISPILNRYAEHEDGKKFALYLLIFFSIQVFYDLIYWGWTINGHNIFNKGYSILSFVPLYLLGRFFKLHRPAMLGRSFRLYFAIYISIFLASAIVVFLLLLSSRFNPLMEKVSSYAISHIDAYTSPFVILGSLCLLLAFESLKFSSQFVNRLAASALAVFCFHSMTFYGPAVRMVYHKFNGVTMLLIDGLLIISVYLIGTLIDQIRISIWKTWSRYVFK